MENEKLEQKTTYDMALDLMLAAGLVMGFSGLSVLLGSIVLGCIDNSISPNNLYQKTRRFTAETRIWDLERKNSRGDIDTTKSLKLTDEFYVDLRNVGGQIYGEQN